MHRFLLIIPIAIIVLSCGLLQPDIYYYGIKTKKIINENISLHRGDSIVILPPIANVNCRYLPKNGERFADTKLRIDVDGENRTKGFINQAIQRYCGGDFKLRTVKFLQNDSTEYFQEARMMFDSLARDSLRVYYLSDRFLNLLRRQGGEKFLIGKIYWEYFDDVLYRNAKSAVYGPVSMMGGGGPKNPAIVIGFVVLVDVKRKSVEYYNSSVLTPSNIQPKGFYGSGEPDDISKKRPGQNFQVNLRLRVSLNRLKRMVNDYK